MHRIGLLQVHLSLQDYYTNTPYFLFHFFDFYVTDAELDNYVHTILQGPEVDPEDEIDVSLDKDDYNTYLTFKVFDRQLH